jgi:sulfite dehydrogenase (quinone) subunit SoeB
MAMAPGGCGSTASIPSRTARAPARAPSISRNPACIARTPACVTVCPTGASYKRAEDGIVLVDEEQVHRLQAVLVGLPLRRARVRRRRRRHEEMHAVHRPHLQRDILLPKNACRPASCVCPTKARGISATSAIRIRPYLELVAARGGADLMPELGYRPVNKYLPPRRATARLTSPPPPRSEPEPATPTSGLLRWVDRLLSR